jgi:hypothetical protein
MGQCIVGGVREIRRLVRQAEGSNNPLLHQACPISEVSKLSVIILMDWCSSLPSGKNESRGDEVDLHPSKTTAKHIKAARDNAKGISFKIFRSIAK